MFALECCVFHRKKEFGESSSESSDDDSDDCDDADGCDGSGHGRQQDCKHAISRRTRSKKRLPPPSASNDGEEEKARAPIEQGG